MIGKLNCGEVYREMFEVKEGNKYMGKLPNEINTEEHDMHPMW